MTTKDSYLIVQHNIKVSKLAEAFGHYLKLDEEKCQLLAVAGVFLDLGKIAMDINVFNQKRLLTEEEFEYVKQHASKSTEILIQSHLISREILTCIIHHHENYDGSGYPGGLKENEIPEGAKILKICDVYLALTEERPYRKEFTIYDAINVMQQESYKYDPYLLSQFIRYIKEKEHILD